MRLIFKLSAKRIKKLQKFFSILTIISLIFQFNYGFLFYHPVLAEEQTSLIEEVEQLTGTETPEETSPSPAGTVTENNSTPEALPPAESSPKEEIPTEVTPPEVTSMEVTPTEVLPTEEPTTAEEKQDSPSLISEGQQEKGELSAVILDNVSVDSVNFLDLDVQDIAQSAQLVTDKADYAPNDTVLISGSGFNPNETYTLIISSENPPPVHFETQVTADENGGFVYAYQLDGIYRPNYKVEAKDKEGKLITSALFTDDQPCKSQGEQCGSDNQCCSGLTCQGSGNNKTCQPVATPTLTPTPTETPTATPTPVPTETPTPTPESNWPDCKYNCTAQDIKNITFELVGDLTGNPLSCSPGTPTHVYIKVTYDNQSSGRYGAYLLGDIYEGGEFVKSIDPQEACLDTMANGLNTYIFDIDFMWDCGQSVEVKNLIIAWDTNSNTCSNFFSGKKCYPPAQSFCGESTSYIVITPLVADFEADTVCYGSPTHFTDKTTGGKRPYTYDWDFDNNGSTDSTIQNPTYTYPAPGDYTAKLKVTDSNTPPATDSQTYQVAVKDCRESITIIKDSVPDDPQDFQFTTTGSDLSSFSLDDDTDEVLSNTKVFSNIQPGQYSITEEEVVGWSLSDISCNGGGTVDLNNRKVDINLSENGNVTCTFTNTKQGTIIVKKDMVGGTDTFEFIGTPSGSISTDLGTIQASVAPGQYTTTETAKTGWDLTNVECDDNNSVGNKDTRTATFNVEAGETVTCTFTNTKRGSITAHKFEDDNMNGIQDSGEEDVAGVNIRLYQGSTCSGTSIDNANTDSSGNVYFDNLSPGDYSVGEYFAHTQWLNITSDCQTVTIQAGENKEVNFGNYLKGNLFVWKYHDLNQNQQHDLDELYLPNWFIRVYKETPSVWVLKGQTNTAPGGNDMGKASFIGVFDSNGIYYVCEMKVNGWSQTDPSGNSNNQSGQNDEFPVCKKIIVNQSGQNETIYFGNIQLGSILIHKFNDRDGDGVKDSDDWVLSGWQMQLFSGLNCQGSPIAQGLTDSNGNKLFSNLLPGQYSVLEVITPWEDGRDWINTTGGACQNVNLNPGEQKNVVFGNYLEGFIKICKVNDLNSNGIYEGEPFISGWTMYLRTPTGQTLSGVTGNDGCYTFWDLSPGNYYLSEEERPDWIRTNPTNPRSYPILFPIASGAGFDSKIYNFQLGKISGYKFEDLDGDGVKDNGEPGLNEWLIELDENADGSVDGTATTNENGYYEFTGLTAGTYRVREQQKAGWQQTTTNPSDITIQSGTVVENVNFGNFQLVKISGRKYEDLNQDGGRDSGEPYLDGWVIRLYDNGWNILGEKTTGHTGNSGQYRFENLLLGTYHVCEVLQTGWKQTGPAGNPNNNSPNKNEEGPRCRTVSITQSGQSRTGQSFGNIRYGGILVHKFEDINGNGQIDGQETGLEDWQIELYQGFDCQEENLILSDLTDNKGDLEFNNLVPGNYSVKEILIQGWQSTTSICQNVIVDGGQIISVNMGNFKLGEVKVCKYDDLNGDGIKDENEPGIAGVSVKLQKQAEEDTLGWADVGDWVDTGADGCYLFGNLGPGVYRAVEDLTDADLAGYLPTDSYLNEESYRVSGELTITSGGSLAVNFLNQLQAITLGISKTNDTSGSIGPGTAVNYTITVTNTASHTAYGVKVVDVLPYGFSYAAGSGKVGGVSLEPSVSGQILTWTVGNLAGGSSIDITYQVITDSGLETGSFANQAYAYGYNRPTGGVKSESDIASSLVKIGVGMTYSATVSPIFGGTVLGAATEGQVLGAATGSPTSHLILAFLMILVGIGARNWEKIKKFKLRRMIKVLILGVGILLTFIQPTRAAVKVTITDLPERINKYEFKVYYTVLDTSESPTYSVQGWMHKEGEGWKQFDITKSEPSGYFQTKGEYFSGEGKYYFKVIGNGVESNIEEVIIDFSSPDSPRDYRKERLSSTEYKLYWRNPSNSDFEKVLVYRSEVRDFTADSSTLVGQRGGAPDQEMDFVDCCLTPNKEYYYALRAIDKAGNASNLVGDGGSTYYLEVTPTLSEVSKTEEVKILPKEEEKKGEILGEEATSSGEEKVSLEEKTAEESIINKVTKNKKILLLGVGVILIILGGTFFLLSRRRSS